MRRASVEHSSPSADLSSFPLDWSELGGQIIACGRQLAAIHVSTFGSDVRRAAEADDLPGLREEERS